jgi:hypothetical protein
VKVRERKILYFLIIDHWHLTFGGNIDFDFSAGGSKLGLKKYGDELV